MSQVRNILKMQGGKNVPAPNQEKKYGHLWVDGTDYGNSEELYNAFAQYARSQSLGQGEFYDQWLTALRNGQDVIFGNGNTVNMVPDDMSERRASKRSNWTKFWDDTFNTRRNRFSDAIATARGFTFTTNEKSEKPKAKDKFNTDQILLNYNPDPKDTKKQHWSTTHTNNALAEKRVADALAWMANPDQFNYEDNDRIAAAYALAKGSDGNGDPNTFAENIWNTMRNYQGLDFQDPDVQTALDWLEAFGIGVTPTTVSTPTGGDSGNSSFINPDGSIDHNARSGNGSFVIQKGNGSGENNGYYTNWNGDTSTPYIITRNDWDTLGLNGPYEFLRNGVIYNGRIWTPEELSTQTGSPLYGIMERVKAINADTSLTGQERFNRLSQLANWYGKANGYNQFDWNSDEYYTINESLRKILNNYKNLSLYDASKSFGFQPGTLFGAYDNSVAGTENWGLRTPFYLIKDQNDRFISIGSDELSKMFPQNTYNPYSANNAFDSRALFTNWVDLMDDGRYFGLAFTVQGSDRDSRTGKLREYQIYEDRDGNFYHKKNNNALVKLDPDLVEWLRNKNNHPNNRQMDTGKLSNTGSNYQVGGGYSRPYKEGGKINTYQIGGSFEGGPNGVQQVNVEQSPLQNASYLQDSLTDADWKEISAAALDLSGAVAGLIPGGSIYTAGSGLVSTGLYLSAAKDRKGKTDLHDWGQAGLSTILDAVSLLPYIGEAGKVVKIGKSISKVAVPLGKVFNMIGLAHLVPTLTKNPKDWTTDDLIALSTGITAALNVGHGAHTTRGESKLASEISKIRGSEPLPEFRYTHKMKVGDAPTDIELTSSEIASIVDKNNKKPDETLKQILKGRGVSDDQLGNPTELLQQFGFEVGGRRRVKVKAHETPKPETYNEKTIAGSVLEQFSPWTSGTARKTYIDTNMSDPRMRAKIEALATKRGKSTSTTQKAINDEITTITYDMEFEDPRLRRAYAQSLSRLGDPNASMNWRSRRIWSGAEANPTTTETTVKRNPTNAQIEAASNFPYRISDDAIQMTRAARENPIGMWVAAAQGLPEVRTVAEATGFKPNVSRSSRLGASGMSNKEIADWANNVKQQGLPAGNEKVTVDDVVALLNSLPENRRWSLIQYFRNNTKGKNTLEAAARFLPKREAGTTTIKDIHERLNNARIVKDTKTKAAFNEARDIASNLVALRESKDPMATLRLLSQKPNFDERAFAHSEEFREALEYAKAHGIYARMSPKQKRQYDFELSQLMEGRNLLFKSGGVLKGLDGFRFGDPNMDSSKYWIPTINAGLGALDYGSMAWGRKKVHDQVEKGLNDSLYKKVTPLLQGITTATPIEDANVDRYDQYVQRGLTTPLTSDNVINTQNVLTLQANALQGREQAVRQQSNAALQRQMQNQQIANQQNTIDAEAENDFRARLAGLKMNLAQNDASWTAQTAQSIQNLAREWRTKFDEQTSKYNQLQYNTEVGTQTEKFNNAWKNHLRTNYSDAWNVWDNMSATDRNKYGNDITTWIQQSDYWNDSLDAEYLENRKLLNQKILEAYKDYNLSPELSWLYRDRYGVPNKKSGGTLTIKQRNRYKNEPSEDIWINQNKATHKLVAKLSDNIIKTFLKTLK